jgi:hypothetical protein
MVVLTVLATATAVVAPADVLVVGSDRDNTLYEDVRGDLSNGAGLHFFAGLNGGGDIRRGLVRFDLTAIPPGAAIESVILTLDMTRTLSGPRSVALHRAAAAWGEGVSDAAGQEGGGEEAERQDATWLHTFFPTELWTDLGGDFEPLASAAIMVGGNGLYSWGTSAGMEADVSTWVDDPSQNFGWVVIGDEAGGSTTAKRFDTREAEATGGFPPQLEITFQPPIPVELQRFVVEGD